MDVERYFDLLGESMKIWDSENKNASPVFRDDVLDLYFVQILRDVPHNEKAKFAETYFKNRDENAI